MFCGRLVCHTEPFATEPALTTTVGLQPYSNGWARMVGLRFDCGLDLLVRSCLGFMPLSY